MSRTGGTVQDSQTWLKRKAEVDQKGAPFLPMLLLLLMLFTAYFGLRRKFLGPAED